MFNLQQEEYNKTYLNSTSENWELNTNYAGTRKNTIKLN